MTTAPAILITGAAGFIGLRVGRALVARGCEVIGYDLVAPDDAGFPIVTGDVRDAGIIAALCGKYRVERILHGGGVSGRAVARDDRPGTIDINVCGTVAVLEAARRHAIKKVVLCSSGSAYGETDADPVTEDTPLRPVNAYGASKVASEAILGAYAAECGIDTAALRIMQAYGPFRQTRCNIRAMVYAAAAREPAMLFNGPEARLQYIYIDDVANALIAALFSDPLPRRAYNVSGGTSLTLRDVVAVAQKVLPELDVRFADDPLDREYQLGRIDQTAVENDLGYRPRFDLARGIRAYADAVKAKLAHAD